MTDPATKIVWQISKSSRSLLNSEVALDAEMARVVRAGFGFLRFDGVVIGISTQF